MLYLAGIDVARLGLGTLTLATSGKTNVVIDLAAVVGVTSDITVTSSKFFMLPDVATLSYYAQNTPDAVTATMTDWSIVPFPRELRTRIRTAMTGFSWTNPTTFDIVYNYTSNHFTFEYGGANFTMTFSQNAGKRLFGYSTSYSFSSAQSFEGNQVPYYTIAATLTRVSDATPNYEPGGVGSHVVPDAPVAGYGVSRMYAPLQKDWVQKFETRAKSHRLDAATSHPFTYQELFEYCRGHVPFLVYDGWTTPITIGGFTCDAEAFMFTNEGLVWNPRNSRATSNNNAQFHHRFMTQVVAGVVAAGS